MTPNQVIDHFGSVAKASQGLGMTRQIIYLWRRQDRVPPLAQKYISALTGLRVSKKTCKTPKGSAK